jgi:hypothetical protein
MVKRALFSLLFRSLDTAKWRSMQVSRHTFPNILKTQSTSKCALYHYIGWLFRICHGAGRVHAKPTVLRICLELRV